MSLQLISPDINLDFVGKRYFFVALSTAINILAIVLLLTKGLNYGVDFVGGTVAQIEFTQKTNGDAIRKALAPLNLGEVTVQDFGKAGQSFLARFESFKNIGGIGVQASKRHSTKPTARASPRWCESRASAPRSAATSGARALPPSSSRPCSWACISRSSSAT